MSSVQFNSIHVTAVMYVKILSLLLLHFQESFGLTNNLGLKYYKDLSYGVKLISEEIAPDVAISLNSISTSNNHESNDFRDTFMKILMSGYKLKIRQQQIDSVKTLSTNVPRRFMVVPIRSYADFKTFYLKLNPNNFFFHGYFVFPLIKRNIDEIQSIFDDMWKVQISNVVVIFKDSHDHLKIFTFFPFRSNSNCSNTTPVLVNEFFNNSFTHKIVSIFPRKMENLHQCEVKVGSSNFQSPHIFTKQMLDGTIKFFGRDYNLIKTISENLNFKIKFKFIERLACAFEITNTTKDDFDLVVVDCWLRFNRMSVFEMSTSYFTEKLVMAFPILPELTSFEKLFYPLALTTWMTLVSFIIIGYLSIFIINRKSRQIQNFVIGEGVNYPYFNMIAGILGLSQNRLPMNNFARFLLINFLILCLVIRTAYQGKLFEVMQANVKHADPQTLAEMERAGYKFHANRVFLDVVANSSNFQIL